MVLGHYVEPHRCWQLISGIVGIYFFYLLGGILHEYILKQRFIHDETGLRSRFVHPQATLIFPSAIASLIGSIINQLRIPKEQRTHIPHEKAIPCAAMVVVSTLTYSYAVMLTNYPVVMMFKSCNLVSVLLVGILCSRVRDKKLQIHKRKIVVGIIISIGIIMFKMFDPQTAKSNQKQTQFAGILLLLVSLLSDGFLPDFQAQIKSIFKPSPMEMMVSVNMWVSILALLYSCVILEVWTMVTYMYHHCLLTLYVVLMGLTATAGQMFVYRMIKQFKQHFVPFVITTRKILTVTLSIIWFGHPTNLGQAAGILIVISLVTYEFSSQLMEEKQLQANKDAPTNDDLTSKGPYPDELQGELQSGQGIVKQHQTEIMSEGSGPLDQ